MVLPPGLAPGPRPHPGLTDHKSAVLLYTTGGGEPRPGVAPGSPAYKAGASRVYACAARNGTSGWIRTITVPLNRRVDYCYPTLVSKIGAHTGICTPVCRLSVGCSAIELCGQVAEDGGHAPQTVSGPIRFQGGPGTLVRFIFQSWLPQMDSHHHSRIQNPESCLLDDTAIKSVPGRNCTCGLKVRNLAFCLLNYGDENGATARTCTRLPPIPGASIAFYASAANCGMPVTLRPIHVGNVVSC